LADESINGNRFIIPEWKRSKDAILDAYFLIINNYSTCYNRYIFRQQTSTVELDLWRLGVRSLFLQIKEYEKDLLKVKREDLDESLKDIKKLAEFTDKLLNYPTVKELRAIAKNLDKDPIKRYKAEAYK